MQILEHILKIRREKAKQEFWQTFGNQFRNAKFKFAMPTSISQCQMPISQCQLQFRNAKCQFRNANFTFAMPIPISHCEISHCEFSQQPCQFRIANFRNSLANFATALRNSQPCELIAKIPTVLPSDFVLRITFSSELRFRRFWYRWKA